MVEAKKTPQSGATEPLPNGALLAAFKRTEETASQARMAADDATEQLEVALKMIAEIRAFFRHIYNESCAHRLAIMRFKPEADDDLDALIAEMDRVMEGARPNQILPMLEVTKEEREERIEDVAHRQIQMTMGGDEIEKPLKEMELEEER